MLKIKTTQNTHYAFSDNDIRILLKGLEQRDREILDNDKICLDPVTLEDNSLQLILERYIPFFEGEEARDQVSLLCPIKIMGEFHWNLLEIKKNGEMINVSLYDTNGCTKPLDGNLKSALSSQFRRSELTFDDGVRQVWTKPGQKGVNCGIIVALMAHQLRLQGQFGSNMDLYAGIDPELTDQQIRDTVSMIVGENCEEHDKVNFCKIRPTADWVAEVKGITYDPKNQGQKQLYEACNALEEGDFQRIKTQIDSFEKSQMSNGMVELITSLRELDCAKFLFKGDDSRELKDSAIDTVKYVNARKEATLAKNMKKISTGDHRRKQSEEQSAVELAVNILVSEAEKLNPSELGWLYRTLKKTLSDNIGNEKELEQLDMIYQILQENILLNMMGSHGSHDEMQLGSEGNGNGGSLGNSDVFDVAGHEETAPGNAIESEAYKSQLKEYSALDGIAYQLTSKARKSTASIYDAFGQESQKSALRYLDEAQFEDKKNQIKSIIGCMLTESDGDAFLSNHQADAVIMATIANLNDKGFLLADQPGVGKTRTMVASAIVHRKLEVHEDSHKKTLVIVSNDNEKDVFEKEINKYVSLLHGADKDIEKIRGQIDIKKVSEAMKLKSHDSYDQVITDEIHSKVDRKSVNQDKRSRKGNQVCVDGDSGVLEKLKKIMNGRKVILASATAVKSLDELRALMPILKIKSKIYDGIKPSQETKGAVERWITSLLISDLQKNSMMVARMLADSKKIEEDMEADRVESSYIESVDSADESMKTQDEQYNEIIRKMNQIRGEIASEIGSQDYKEINSAILTCIERFRESMILSKKLSEAKEEQKKNPGHHILLCTQEYGDQKNRVESMTSTMTAKTGSETVKQMVVELKDLCESFPLVTRESLIKDDIVFNPNEINVKNQEKQEKDARIYVCSKSHLQGVNLNGLLTKEASGYRERIKKDGGKFQFHLEIIGSLDGWDRVWQAMHRVIRYDNDVNYGSDLKISQSHFIGEHSRINAKRFTQRCVLSAFRAGKNDKDLDKSLIIMARSELSNNPSTSSDQRYQKLIKTTGQDDFLLEMDFLDIDCLREVNKIIKAKERELKRKNHKNIQSEQLKLLHTGKTKDSKIYQYEDFLVCTKSGFLEYERYLSSIFGKEVVMFDVKDIAEKHVGLKFLKDSTNQKYLCSQEAFMAFDDLTEEEALALVKISRFNDGKKRKARKMSGKKIKHSKKQKGVFKKPENRKKRDRSNSDNADKILRFGLSNEVSEKEGEEKGPKKIKTTVEPIKDTEDHGQKTKKRRKENHEISNQKQKVVRLAKICGEFLEFAADTSSDYSQKREEFKQYLEKCLTLYGYDILLERVKDGATDYHYSFYHLCLAFNEWDIVEFCEQKRGGQQSALGVLSKGKYHEDDYNGWSLLHRAVFERNISAVEYLCDQERVSGALLNWKTKDKDDQCTALHMAMANFTASFKAMSDTKSIIDTSSAEGCVGDIKIVEELVSPMGRTAIEGHDIDMPDDQGRLPLELVMKESREALMFLLENVDEPTKLRLQKQKEVIEKQVRDSMDDEEAENSTGTEPFSGEDLSMDQSSDHSDSKEEEDYEEELTEHHQQIMKMIQKKTQERKEKEQKASEFIEKLESKNYFNYSDFVNLSEALRLNKQPRSLLISTLGYFVEAFKQENKMSCIFGGGAKVCQMKIAPLEMGKVSALNTKTVKLSDLSEYEQVKNNLQKMIQNQMVTNEEIKQMLNCTIFDRQEKVKYCQQILSVDRSIIRDLVLDYLSKWALGMGYQKTSHARPSDSVNSEIDERLTCHYQESNPSIESASDTHNIFDLMALHGKGEFIEMLKDLGIDVKRKSKNGNMLHTLLGASSQDNIDEDQVKKLVDIMIEAGAFDQENDQRPSTLDVLLSRNNDSDFIYFLELLLSGLVHAKSVPFIANGIDWDALIQDEKWRKMEKRFNMVNSKLQKGRYSSFFTGGITDKLYNCNENLEAIHGFQSIREKMSDTKDKASHRRKYPMTLERKDHMSGREEGGSSDFDWSEGLESTGWEESEKRLLSVLAEDGETNDLIEAIKNDRVVEVERISHHRNHGPQDWYLEALSVLAEDGETNELIEAIKNDRVVEVERISRHSKDEEVIEKSIWYLAEKEKFRTAHVILLDRLDAGIKIEHILKSKDKNGMTILMRACKAKIRNYKFVDFLLGCGASMEERDNDGNNALMHAAIPPCHNDKLFKELVRKLKGKEQNITKDVSSIICSVNKEGMNILHVLFKNLNSGEDSHATIKALIDMGADINQADRLGNTPLMYACQNNIIREIEKLPREGMDVNKRNKSGMTALMLCNCDSGTKLQAELIKRGARIDIVSEDRETALTLACRNNNHRYVDLLLKKIKDMSDREERRKILNQQGKDGKTALMIAIGFRSLFITRQLLWSNDLNLELHDNMGISALGAACRSANGNCYGNVNANVQAYALLDKIESLEDKEKVRRILNHQEQKSSGKTPLMIAAGLKSDAIIKRLLKYKSELNLELKDHDGRTAWMIANDRKDRKFKNVMDQLRNVEAENVTAENPTSSGFGSTLFGPDDTNTNGTQSQNAKSGDILETDGSVMDGDYKLNDALSFFVDTEANQDEDEEDTKIWEERFKKFQHDF